MDSYTVTDMCVDRPTGGGRSRALPTVIYREAAGGKRELRQLIKLRHRRTAAHRIAAQLHTAAQVEREHCRC